jgi:hypothetical protein
VIESRLEYSGLLLVTCQRVLGEIIVVSISGDPMDAKWLRDSISTRGATSTFWLDQPGAPSPGEFFLITGQMCCKRFFGDGTDEEVDLGFLAEGFEELDSLI